MRNGMTNVPKRLMNVPPKRIHAAGGRALTLSRNDCTETMYHAETRRRGERRLREFEANAFPQVAEDRADQRAGGVPDDVVDVGDSVGEEVLPPFDRAGEGEAEEDRQNVRLQRRPIDRVERDEEQEPPRHE